MPESGNHSLSLATGIHRVDLTLAIDNDRAYPAQIIDNHMGILKWKLDNCKGYPTLISNHTVDAGNHTLRLATGNHNSLVS